ncbi:MAG: hypothetical protein HFF62_16015 [Oscillospiraceae bacterium]|nr:hypothetical protein [Oscillospiraceae bacterium]
MATKVVTSISDLYGKELIAYGTGAFGKDAIPILAQTPNIQLLGVTNSSITEDDMGTFQSTGLPVRSANFWIKKYPKVAALITVANYNTMNEICLNCAKAGFQEVFCLSPCVTSELYISQRERLWGTSYACYANEIHDTHKATFSEFRACHRGQTVAVIASGPSLNYYTQIPGIPHIGMNASFLRSGLKLDYYFLYHYIPEWRDALKQQKFVKFFAYPNIFDTAEIPECFFEEANARRFFLNLSGADIHGNIEYHPLMMFGSIVFPAIHFALYTRPQKLLLVGCDCTVENHFDGRPVINHNSEPDLGSMWIEGYKEVKKFVTQHYPDTEIISINPVGLRGIFCDIYTENYLNAHPGMDLTGCQILNLNNLEDI